MISLLSAAIRRGAALGLALALPALAAARDISPFSGRDWLENYHRHPAPERFVPAVFDLSRTQYFNVPGNIPVGLGFFATLFRQHADYVDDWLQYCRMLPDQEQRLIASALWIAGHPKGEAYLRRYADEIVGPAMREQLQQALAHQRAFDERTVDSSRALHLKWGSYLVTGDETVLAAVLTGADQLDDLSVRERWWLACAAAGQDAVVAFCLREQDTAVTPTSDMMRLVLDAREVMVRTAEE